jgi:hypothetical protein
MKPIRKRDERIPQSAANNGEFVIDVGQFFMSRAEEVAQSRRLRDNSRDLFPVFDSKTGQSIGNMTAEAFLRKIL